MINVVLDMDHGHLLNGQPTGVTKASSEIDEVIEMFFNPICLGNLSRSYCMFVTTLMGENCR